MEPVIGTKVMLGGHVGKVDELKSDGTYIIGTPYGPNHLRKVICTKKYIQDNQPGEQDGT